MSNNPYDDTHNSPPEHVDHPVRPEVGAHTQKDDVDSRTILLAGSFLALFVVVLVLAVIAFFHHYRHVLEAQKEATVSAWSAAIHKRQIASIQPHWVGNNHKQATVGIELAEDMVVAQYTPNAKSVLLPPAPEAASTGAAAPAVPLHVLGAKLYASLGCIACHTVNGNPGVGPSWKNLAGYPQKLTNGKTVIADYKFLRTMILHPGTLLVAGAPAGVMPATYGPMLSGKKHPHETKLNAIIWYINTLSNRSSKATQPPVPDNPAK
jgi:mono/diheme cytochrome c family protein